MVTDVSEGKAMFISKLGQLMESRGLNQSELSRATGLTHNTIRKFLKGHFDRLDGETVDTLMQYFGLSSLSELVEFQTSSETQISHHPPKHPPKHPPNSHSLRMSLDVPTVAASL